MSIKSPANDDWIRYDPLIHKSGLKQFGAPNNTGDAWRHGAYKGETSASNPLRRHVATATNVLVVTGCGPIGTGMEETYQLTSALKFLPFLRRREKGPPSTPLFVIHK